MSESLILVGGGGHCKSCIEVIESGSQFTIEGVIDAQATAGSRVLDYPMLGNDEMIEQYVGAGNYFLITVGQIQSAGVRIKLAKRIQQHGGKLATVHAATASVSKRSQLGEGSIAMQHAIVNSDVQIGIHAILNNRCLVEHDCTVGDFCHISTGAIINGQCTIGNRVFIGSGAVLVQGISIADDVVIGAGAVVQRPVTEPGVYVGNPARKIA